MALALLAAAPVSAACTHEQATARGEALSRAVQARMARDPGGARALMQRLQQIGQSDEQHASFPDWTKVCATYDAMLAAAN